MRMWDLRLTALGQVGGLSAVGGLLLAAGLILARFGRRRHSPAHRA
jgi:hypothetical protein